MTEADCELPEAQIISKPSNPTKSPSAAFTFASTPPGAAFECKLDTGAYVECLSVDEEPYEYPGPLADGSHTFQVRAVNSLGAGASAVHTWIVDTQAPTTTIKTSPANPSSGASAAFAYESSQLGSSFECSLAGQGQADSFSSCPPTGQTYSGLADGSFTFKVRSTDKAGNQGSPAAYTWQVNNSLVIAPPVLPLAPPLTTIPPPATTPRAPAPLRCKKGFVKKKVKGKMRCVKKRPKKKRKR